MLHTYESILRNEGSKLFVLFTCFVSPLSRKLPPIATGPQYALKSVAFCFYGEIHEGPLELSLYLISLDLWIVIYFTVHLTANIHS